MFPSLEHHYNHFVLSANPIYENKEGKAGERTMVCDLNKPVHVRAYKRFRFGQWEYVCEHWRSLPSR